MGNIDDEVIERLEAEVLTADADAEELSLYSESEIEEKDERVEELQSQIDEKEDELSEKESEVEELQSQIEEKETEIEEMSEHVDSVAETYAEELAAETPALDKDDYLDKFEFEELKQKHEEAFDGSSPNPQSGDPGAGFQNPEGGEDGGSDEPEELSKKAQVAAEQFRQRGGVWEDLAEDIEENGLGEVRKADKSDDVSVFE